MKLRFPTFLLALAAATLMGQEPDASTTTTTTTTNASQDAPPQEIAPIDGGSGGGAPTAPTIQNAPAPPVAMRADEGGLWVNMELNDLLSVLARKSKFQYFSNPSLDGKMVRGHVRDGGDPVTQMQAVCLQYNVTLFERKGTIYALDDKQVAAMPRREFIYTVKYLRGRLEDDQKALVGLIQPALSERGSVKYEEKTGTLLVIDHEAAVESVRTILERIDVPKQQVVVEVKILRVENKRGNRLGIDWSNTLGKDGLSISATALGKLNSLFTSTPSFVETVTGEDAGATTAGGIILNPVTVTAVLRALNDANLATQENAPSLITEDNEQAVVRITDRIPIIEQTATQSAGVSQITTDVRYRIDKSDSLEPDKSREIGVTVTVTPSILPDGTIRMRMHPRVANVTEFINVQTGVDGVVNQVPRVGEAGVESIARIPNGYTLLLGGYYQIEERTVDSKVPFLGDIPGLSFVFRSKQREKNRANIIFMLTPTAYDPASDFQTVAQTERLKQRNTLPKRLDFPDDDNPGENEVPRPVTRARNFIPFWKPKPPLHPLSEDVNVKNNKVETAQERKQREMQSRVKGRR